MHKVVAQLILFYHLEQKVAYLAQRSFHSLNERARIEFCNTTPSQQEDALVPSYVAADDVICLDNYTDEGQEVFW